MTRSKFFYFLLSTSISSIVISQILSLSSYSLVIAKPAQEQKIEVDRLYKEGVEYYNSGRYSEALRSYQRALALYRKAGNRYGEANILNEVGVTYQQLGEMAKAIEFYHLALSIRQQINDQDGLGFTFNSLSEVYQQLGSYDLALQAAQQSLEIRRKLGDQVLLGDTLTTIGSIYNQLSNYIQALEFYEQALTIARKERDRNGEAILLTNIATVHTQLGEYAKAIKNYQQSLPILQKLGDRFNEAGVLHNMGFTYARSGQYLQAINVYQQALAIRRKIGSKEGEAATLNNLGFAYSQLERNFEALTVLEQALPILRRVDDRMAEGNTLDSLGTVYRKLGNHLKSRYYYYQALTLFKASKQRFGERTTLSNLGDLYSQQKQPASAILFYKQSVEVTETIRQEIKALSREQQESYTKTVEDTYRNLAKLLLLQGRLLEAQEVLELLKIQEIRSIDQDTRATLAASGIEYTDTEKEINKEHGSLIALGEKLYNCETQPKTCTLAQSEQWKAQRRNLFDQFEEALNKVETEAKNGIFQSASAGKDDFISAAKTLVESEPGTLLIYPFVTENEIWLLWASAGGILDSTKVPGVGRNQLLQAVKDYRDRLEKPPSNDPSEFVKLQQSGQKLYDWLIKPLEPALASKSIKHLVFSLDGTTRYIPMSALVDRSQKYLIQKYVISTVLNAGETIMKDRLPSSAPNTSVLAFGVTDDFPPEFLALGNVKSELTEIVRADGDTRGIYPGKKFFNKDFDRAALENNLSNQNILHIATHAEFYSTHPNDSFLLLGNGEKYPIRKIKGIPNLSKINLVVLSACKTALNDTAADGKEILGISAYFTGGENKAKAVLAALWKVNDTSTSELMQQFYQNLATGSMTKAEALQKAQLNMIQKAGSRDLSHPYYWAPFILIGNWL
ncbi:MAG: tetratricopeptide repeat protein (plasmid) [Leptolyngbya sp. BL-A-14]